MMLRNGEFFVIHPTEGLKAVLLHNGNSFSSILIGHLVQMKKIPISMDHLLSAVNYQEHKWLICGDLNVVELVLGLQGGYTKKPYFLEQLV